MRDLSSVCVCIGKEEIYRKKNGLLLAVLLAALAFTGCGSTKYQDGSYRAEAADFDQHGWKEFLDITVTGGKITSVDFDALYKDDLRRKSEDMDYQKAYREAGLGTDPADYCIRLEDSLLERQKAAQVDAVAGATTSSEHFRQMAEQLQKAMEAGNTDTVYLSLE